MTVEQMQASDGKPKDRSYLERDLPASLQKALDEYIQGEKDQVSYMDCLWGELYGAINSNQWSNAITEEQADYLRAKYLEGGGTTRDRFYQLPCQPFPCLWRCERK